MLICLSDLQVQEGYEVYNWFLGALPKFKKGLRALIVKPLLWNRWYKLVAPIKLNRVSLSLKALATEIDARLLEAASQLEPTLTHHSYIVIELVGNNIQVKHKPSQDERVLYSSFS